MAPKLKMVTLNQIMHKLIWSNASLLIWKLEKCIKLYNRWRWLWLRWKLPYIKNTIPTTPLFPRICRASRCIPIELPAILATLSPGLQVRLFGQHLTTRIWHQPLLHIKPNPSFWYGFGTSHRGWRLRHAMGKLFLHRSQRPITTIIKTSLTRRKCP